VTDGGWDIRCNSCGAAVPSTAEMCPACDVVFPLVLLYYPVMESSRLQATLGKRFCGLTVVTTGVKRISFARALLRFLARYLSGALFGIGYLMIAFRSDRRGLHDMIAGTLVLWR
jgi:uncharacterized RDD family membrane protein YckC